MKTDADFTESNPETVAELMKQIMALVLGFHSAEAVESIAAALVCIITDQASDEGEAHLAISEISDLLHRSINHQFQAEKS